jgi:uncharacterized membrane protein
MHTHTALLTSLRCVIPRAEQRYRTARPQLVAPRRCHQCAQGANNQGHRDAKLSVSTSRPLRCRWKAVPALTMLMLAVHSTLLCTTADASIGEAVATSLRQMAPDWVVVTVLASLPVVELRGAIPVGIALLGLPPWLVFLCAVLGNSLIVPAILVSLPPLLRLSERVPALSKGLNAFLLRAQKQTQEWSEGDVFWMLAWFVAVPLPGTGAWSGSFIAFVLGMPFSAGVGANVAGVCCAGALVTGLVCMGWAGFWLACIVLLVLPLISFLMKSMKADPRG